MLILLEYKQQRLLDEKAKNDDTPGVQLQQPLLDEKEKNDDTPGVQSAAAVG